MWWHHGPVVALAPFPLRFGLSLVWAFSGIDLSRARASPLPFDFRGLEPARLFLHPCGHVQWTRTLAVALEPFSLRLGLRLIWVFSGVPPRHWCHVFSAPHFLFVRAAQKVRWVSK